MTSNVLTAFFSSRAAADRAYRKALSTGLAEQDITVIEKRISRPDDLGLRARSKTAEGAALGGVIGGAVGAAVLGIGSAGSLVVPAVGLVVAGPLVAALAGAGAFGA